MRLWVQLVDGHALKLVQQAVAALAIVAVVGVNAEAACWCLVKVTPRHDGACCCAGDGATTAVVQADTCGSTCLRAPAKSPVGEIIAVPDSAPPSSVPASVPVVHLAGSSAPAPFAPLAAPSPSLSSSHPILRI